MQRNLGRSGVTSTEDSDVDAWINYVIREDICADHNWSGMEFTRTRTLTASDADYAWQNPTVFKDARWIAIRYQSGEDYQFLTEITLNEIHSRSLWTEQTEGFPRVWARDGDGYVLRPIPDDTYALRERVWEYPAEIATGSGSDSSTNFVTDYWPKLLEFGVTARGCLYYGEQDLYQFWLAAYRDELGKAIGVDRKRLSPAQMTMRPSAAAGQPEPGGSVFGSRLPPYGWL